MKAKKDQSAISLGTKRLKATGRLALRLFETHGAEHGKLKEARNLHAPAVAPTTLQQRTWLKSLQKEGKLSKQVCTGQVRVHRESQM